MKSREVSDAFPARTAAHPAGESLKMIAVKQVGAFLPPTDNDVIHNEYVGFGQGSSRLGESTSSVYICHLLHIDKNGEVPPCPQGDDKKKLRG
jgi:hypothetical protein